MERETGEVTLSSRCHTLKPPAENYRGNLKRGRKTKRIKVVGEKRRPGLTGGGGGGVDECVTQSEI